MRKNYKKQVELINKLLQFDENLTVQEEELNFDNAMKIIEELISTRETEALIELLDIFTEENEDYGGICESSMSMIASSFDTEQKFEALCLKFKDFINKDLWRCSIMSAWFFYEEYFERFRKVFNTVKSENSKEFLKEIQNLVSNESEKYVTILRNDMQKW